MAADAEAVVAGAGGCGMAATERLVTAGACSCGMAAGAGVAAAGSGGFKLPDNRVSVIVALNAHAVKDLEAILQRHAHPQGLT